MTTLERATLRSGHVIEHTFQYRGRGEDMQVSVLATSERSHVIQWVYLRDVVLL